MFENSSVCGVSRESELKFSRALDPLLSRGIDGKSRSGMVGTTGTNRGGTYLLMHSGCGGRGNEVPE